MIPYACLKRLKQAGKALELDSRSVVLADGSAQQVVEFLVEGLVVGGCEIRSARVVCCKDPKLAFPAVLGMDTLQRLPNLVMRFSPEGGMLTFDCPARALDIDACGDDDVQSEGGTGNLNYAVKSPQIPGMSPCVGR
jgi:hypothetical protein